MGGNPQRENVCKADSVRWLGITGFPRPVLFLRLFIRAEKITIYPLEIEYFGEKVFFTDHYSVKEWKKGDPLPEIHEWYPHIKKARCNPCRNCGRC